LFLLRNGEIEVLGRKKSNIERHFKVKADSFKGLAE